MLELLPDRPTEWVWNVLLLVALMAVAFVVPWLARRGWALPGGDDRDRRRSVLVHDPWLPSSGSRWRCSRGLRPAFGGLWFWSNTLSGAP
jgi:hypothetical protein